jgi:hypothetical protein
MIEGQLGRGMPVATIVTNADSDPVAPPLGTAQIAGFLPLAAQLFLGDIAEEGHDKKNTEFSIQNTAENQ